MKFETVLVLFAGVASAYSPPICKAPSKQCKYTSSRDAKECRKLFAQRYIPVATCRPPTRTITSTRTVCQTTVTTRTIKPPATTKKVTTTTTKTGKPTTRPTTTLTATSTNIQTTTATDTTTSTEFNTVTETETETGTVTDTETFTVTSTTTQPWEQPTCDSGPFKRGIAYGSKQYNKKLPSKCSCFLTTTKPAAVVTATITTRKRPITRTVYKVGGSRPTIIRTVTLTRYAAGPTLSAPEKTITITTTITQTDRTLTTITKEQTSTSTATTTAIETDTITSTTTSTATATEMNRCGDMGWIKMTGQSYFHPHVGYGYSSEAKDEEGIRACCTNCYNSRDCVYFRVGYEQCDYFFSKNTVTNPCTSDACRMGIAPVFQGPGDGFDYYMGRCIGTIITQS